MAVLMLVAIAWTGMRGTMFMVLGTGTGVIAEDAVIAGNLVCQTGLGQTIECSIQGDPVHLCQFILQILMRYRTARL